AAARGRDLGVAARGGRADHRPWPGAGDGCPPRRGVRAGPRALPRPPAGDVAVHPHRPRRGPAGAPTVRRRARRHAPAARRRLVTSRFIRIADDEGLQVHVWTVDERDDMHRLLDAGVDGIITDRPDTLRAVLEERGQWRP